MRKSCAMLILAALFITSTIFYSGDTGGRTMDDLDPALSGVVERGVETTEPIVGTYDGSDVGDVLVDTSVQYYYGTSNDIVLEGSPETRGAVNTSTLLYIKKAPKKVYFGQNFGIEGELIEDNNSDEEKNSGDYPLTNSWVQFTWAEGTEWQVQYWNTTDENGTWVCNLTANLTSTDVNGNPNSPNPGVEFQVYHMGTWTTSGQGQEFYNLTMVDYNKLVDKAVGRDDDGDSVIKQYNRIDDDDDGEANSPDSFLDGSNGFSKDGVYQVGEDVDYDRSGGGWIDLNHGLFDYIDQDGNGELFSPDSYKDGSNDLPDDNRHQHGEELARDRFESHYNVVGYTFAPLATKILDLGSLGPGAVIDYTFSVNRSEKFDLALFDGTTVTNLVTDSYGSTGQHKISTFGTYSLRFVSNSSKVCSVSYQVEVLDEQQVRYFVDIAAQGTHVYNLGTLPAGTVISYDWAEKNWTTPYENRFNLSLKRGSASYTLLTYNRSSSMGTINIANQDTYQLIWSAWNTTSTTNISYNLVINRPSNIDPGHSIGARSTYMMPIGTRGFSEFDYIWYANGNHSLSFGFSDGTTTTWLSTNMANGYGYYQFPQHGTTSLVWRNQNDYPVRIGYKIDMDIDWIDIDMAIADGLDNDFDGYVDEGIDDGIDDGRPGIPAFQMPEAPEKWYNGIDDDNDGIVDDGYPGIKVVGNSGEGIDEEIYDGIDNDGDGEIDEDPFAFIARKPAVKKLFIEIWHKTKLTINIDNPLIDVGKNDFLRVNGTLEDFSVPDNRLTPKVVRLLIDGDVVAEKEATPEKTGYKSAYEFLFTPNPIYKYGAGPHDVTVQFSPAFNKELNYYYDPSNATGMCYIRRPTKVIFNDLDPLTGVSYVYRGHIIYINGSIVDKYMYEEQGIKSGPKLNVNGIDYGTQYRFNVMWGETLQTFHKMWAGLFLVQPDGNFSIEYDLPAGSQPLGPVTVSVETNFDQNPRRDPLLYYSNSENTTKFIVRSRTQIEMFIDQNDNGRNDETEQTETGDKLITFITRDKFTGPDGKVYYWNTARIRGLLKDVEQSIGALKVGVPNQKVKIYWGFGQTWQQIWETETDQNGNFQWNYVVPSTHPLGPVPMLAVYNTEFFTNYYDSSSTSDFDGMPFSVVSYTGMNVTTGVGIKGQSITVRGQLKDDRNVGIGNKTVQIYRRDTWDGSYAQIRSDPGVFLGTATTDATGKYVFREYVLDERVSVGHMWVVARYAGSKEFPDPLSNIRYYPNDAYMPVLASPSKLVVTSETSVFLKDVPKELIRGGEARITGNVFESFKGQRIQRGVAGQTVTAYLKQGDEILKLGVSRTRTDPEFNGYFEIKAPSVPDKLSVGEVLIIVECTPEVGPDNIPLYQISTNETKAQVWSQTRIQDVHIGPKDDDGDRRIDLYEDKTNEWVFTFQVLEGSATDVKGEPVQFGEIYMNISMGAYTNSTRLITDLRGRVNFNYTARFKDSNTGFDFQIPSDQDNENMTITIKFVGKQYYRDTVRVFYSTYHRAEPPKEDRTRFGLILLVIFMILLMGLVGLFFFYRWIEKRRRLKALKKIIKKAADQLETGNPYSAVIFRAYQKLGAHFRKYGFLRRDADTFREFEDAVRSALPIDDNSLNAFLDILEEARYSKHVIGEEHKETAIRALRGVEKSLDNIILDEEAAIRQMEIQDEEFVETEIVLKDKKGA